MLGVQQCGADMRGCSRPSDVPSGARMITSYKLQPYALPGLEALSKEHVSTQMPVEAMSRTEPMRQALV